MSIIEEVKRSRFGKKVKDKPFIILLCREYWRIKGKNAYKKHNDFEAVQEGYRSRTGRELNLRDPQRFYEKLNWMKLFYHTDLIRECSSKYTVRDYINRIGKRNLLNDQLAAYKSVDEINLDSLPDSFVIKASHGSGWNLIVKDKSKVNWRIWKKIMNSWLKQNAAWFGREWNYETDDPRLVVERYLEDETGELRDYKVFCFHGMPKFVMIEEDRYSSHSRIFLDTNGQKMGMGDGFGFKESMKLQIDKKVWSEILAHAADISKPFPHVRADFYVCNGKVYFGELTFYNDAGYASFYPDNWDFIWGDTLQLPEPNYNLELYRRIAEQAQ